MKLLGKARKICLLNLTLYIDMVPYVVRFHSFLTCVVPVFPLTLLLYPSFTPVKIVAYDL